MYIVRNLVFTWNVDTAEKRGVVDDILSYRRIERGFFLPATTRIIWETKGVIASRRGEFQLEIVIPVNCCLDRISGEFIECIN